MGKYRSWLFNEWVILNLKAINSGWNMIENKKVLCIIPARGGSKGIPKKNLLNIGGFSLLERAILTAEKSNYIDTIIVSSDS